MPDNAPFAVLDPEFFVSFDRRPPGPEFRDLVQQVLPADAWRVAQVRGVWTHVHPRGWKGLPQGWKLHVSTLPGNASATLRAVAEVLRDHPAAFKFASDRRILDLIHTKNWPREGGGKFVTVYPNDDAHFQCLAHALARATEGMAGPYILSDRRVPGSMVVFYRYGEHLAAEGVDARGRRVAQVAGPDGASDSDQRRGYYHHPEWVHDPYGAPRVARLDEPEAPTVMLNGRYEVTGALKYSNLGGIYRARDLERGEPVIIRERRPGFGWVRGGTDCVAMLEKEARILRAMDGTGWTPRYVDAFPVWEHHYLVMEEVSAVDLRDFASSRYMLRGKVASPRRIFWSFRRVILNLARGIEAFHRRGIILRDLSVANVLVRRDRSVCFIDLEFAWERDGGQPWVHVETPGYASAAQVAGAEPSEADDWYSLGAMVVEMCSFLSGGLRLNPDGMLDAAGAMMDEVGLPRALLQAARGLLDPDPAARWNGGDVRRALGAVKVGSVAWAPREPGRTLAAAADPGAAAAAVAGASETAEAVCRFFEAAARPDQDDCLWPASPELDRTNPVSILFGAAGPLEHVRRVRGGCPDAWLDWVEARAVPERCPPGMYAGLAGVALALDACGREASARRLLRAAAESPLLGSSSGLYHGAAGVALAALAVGVRRGDAELRETAVRLGDALAARARRTRHGLAWPEESGRIASGVAAGGAGIALFYTYLGAATGQARHWATAREALDFELAQGSRRGGYLMWPDAAGRWKRLWSPHVSFGSAGMAMAAARLYACTGDPGLRAWAERAGETLTFRWTNKLWHDMGYAGWGETLLDLHAATGDPRWRRHALRMAEAILLTRVRTRFGTAFPGGSLHRVTSDFGMGTAGIALFLHRLAHGGHRAFLPDELLPRWPAAAPAPETTLSARSARGTSGKGAAPRPAARAPARGRARTPA
jgi:hypothetical protein